MAIKSLNSIGGFSVSELVSGNVVIVIDSSGNVSTPDLTVTGRSNLGAVANITITGGSNGQVLTTDGAGNLTFSTPAAGGADLMPFFIPVGETYTISNNRQGLFALPITIEGDLVVDGILIQVS